MLVAREHVLFLLVSVVCQTSILKDCFKGYYCDNHRPSRDVFLMVSDLKHDRCYDLYIDHDLANLWDDDWAQDVWSFEDVFTFVFPFIKDGRVYCDKRIINDMDVEAWVTVTFLADRQRLFIKGSMCLNYNSTFDSDDVWGSLYKELIF